ncbi:MAG: hypothetical protein IPL28_04725 [Chloroflexi bacterium]|nr:hypothetical protein [Chloroflexota bacterium]
MHHLEINGGRVLTQRPAVYKLILPPQTVGYGDAQLDDYHGRLRRRYPWRQGTHLHLRARFSHGDGTLIGTAGFGFWNAPFGDPATRWPALPQAVWFFYASSPSDLPLAPTGAGRGWFAGTVDATRGRALALAPFAPLVVLGNRWPRFRQQVWPWVQTQLSISYQPIPHDMTEWHSYELIWLATGCRFVVDGQLLLETPHTPRGPLGFVCWVDNQYMVVTAEGRLRWGVSATTAVQWLEISIGNI